MGCTFPRQAPRPATCPRPCPTSRHAGPRACPMPPPATNPNFLRGRYPCAGRCWDRRSKPATNPQGGAGSVVLPRASAWWATCVPHDATCHQRGTSRIRNTPPVGPGSSPMPGDLLWSCERPCPTSRHGGPRACPMPPTPTFKSEVPRTGKPVTDPHGGFMLQG